MLAINLEALSLSSEDYTKNRFSITYLLLYCSPSLGDYTSEASRFPLIQPIILNIFTTISFQYKPSDSPLAQTPVLKHSLKLARDPISESAYSSIALTVLNFIVTMPKFHESISCPLRPLWPDTYSIPLGVVFRYKSATVATEIIYHFLCFFFN